MKSAITRRGRLRRRPPLLAFRRPPCPAVAGPRFVYSLELGPVPIHPSARADLPTLTLDQTAAMSGWAADTLADFHRLIGWALDNDVSGPELAAILSGEGGGHA